MSTKKHRSNKIQTNNKKDASLYIISVSFLAFGLSMVLAFFATNYRADYLVFYSCLLVIGALLTMLGSLILAIATMRGISKKQAEIRIHRIRLASAFFFIAFFLILISPLSVVIIMGLGFDTIGSAVIIFAILQILVCGIGLVKIANYYSKKYKIKSYSSNKKSKEYTDDLL